MPDSLSPDDTARLLASLALPSGAGANAEWERARPVDIPLLLQTLVDSRVLDQVWRGWAEDELPPASRVYLQDLLGRSVRMGYRIDRFRDMARLLPEPDGRAEAWRGRFEQAVEERGPTTIRLFLNPAEHELFVSGPGEGDGKDLDAMLAMMSDGLCYELGIIYPRVDVRPDPSVSADRVRIVINDAVLPDIRGLRADQAMVNDSPERLRLLNIAATRVDNPASANEYAVIEAAHVSACEAAGLTTWDRRGYAVLALSAALRAMASGFVNRYLAEHYLDKLREAKPRLIAEVERRVSRDSVVAVLRDLVDEEISIRDLPAILEELVSPRARVDADGSRLIIFAHGACSVATHAADLEDDNLLRVRAALRRNISHKYSRGQNTLVVYLLSPETERRLEQADPLSHREREALLEAVHAELPNRSGSTAPPVILTTETVRRRLRREIRNDFPRVAVLSYQELSPDLNIQPIARFDPELKPIGLEPP